MLHYLNGTWTTTYNHSTHQYRGVDFVSPDQGFAVGSAEFRFMQGVAEQGIIERYEKGEWKWAEIDWPPYWEGDRHNWELRGVHVIPWASSSGRPIYQGWAVGVDVEKYGPRTGILVNAGPLVAAANPDLTGQWNFLNQTCKTSDTTRCKINGSFIIQNTGNQKARSSSVDFYLSDDDQYDEGDTFLKRISTGPIKAGDSTVKKLRYRLPAGESASGKYIMAVIDPEDVVTESDETNNEVAYGPIPSSGVDLDQETKDNVARALWLPAFDPSLVPQDILSHLNSPENAGEAFGRRMGARLKRLLARSNSFTPSYEDRYKVLIEHSSSLNAHQAYVMTNLLGLDSNRGYEELPLAAHLKFPRDHATQSDFQVDWYYFAGNCSDAAGRRYGILVMFYYYSLLPPPMARQFGLSEKENRVVDIQFAVTEEGSGHHQVKPVVLAGTTGLLSFERDPLVFRAGKNSIESLKAGSLFPLRIRARGTDLSEEPQVEIGVDLHLDAAKPFLLEGANGCSPCCDGVGTLYYSAPRLVLGAESRLTIHGKEVDLQEGTFWFDHQWSTGLAPSGGAKSKVLRAARNLSPTAPPGWDWFMAQFQDGRELGLSSIHTTEWVAAYNQTGSEPPGTMIAPVSGKYVDEDGTPAAVSGLLVIDRWVRAENSCDPAVYPPTHVWYPARWSFTFGEPLPPELRQFSMEPLVATDQTTFFAVGAQYAEAAVRILSPAGALLGYGFAESVGYADTMTTILSLAGLPSTPQMVNLMRPPEPSAELVAESEQFLSKPHNQKHLQEIIDQCIAGGLSP